MIVVGEMTNFKIEKAYKTLQTPSWKSLRSLMSRFLVVTNLATLVVVDKTLKKHFLNYFLKKSVFQTGYHL